MLYVICAITTIIIFRYCLIPDGPSAGGASKPSNNFLLCLSIDHFIDVTYSMKPNKFHVYCISLVVIHVSFRWLRCNVACIIKTRRIIKFTWNINLNRDVFRHYKSNRYKVVTPHTHTYIWMQSPTSSVFVSYCLLSTPFALAKQKYVCCDKYFSVSISGINRRPVFNSSIKKDSFPIWHNF